MEKLRDPAKLSVVLGEHDIENESETELTKSFDVESYVLHPYFNYFESMEADVALIKMKMDADLMIYTPACLPFIGEDFLGYNGFIYGS